MTALRYVIGDATAPKGPGVKLIAHVCNTAGVWGAGFVLAISARSGAPEASYRNWYAERGMGAAFANPPFRLGEVKVAPFTNDQTYVANMIAQTMFDKPPLRYYALRQCLARVAALALAGNASVHMPDLIGCGLAGGDRQKVLAIIKKALTTHNIPVTIYTLP